MSLRKFSSPSIVFTHVDRPHSVVLYNLDFRVTSFRWPEFRKFKFEVSREPTGFFSSHVGFCRLPDRQTTLLSPSSCRPRYRDSVLLRVDKATWFSRWRPLQTSGVLVLTKGVRPLPSWYSEFRRSRPLPKPEIEFRGAYVTSQNSSFHLINLTVKTFEWLVVTTFSTFVYLANPSTPPRSREEVKKWM